ncbi:hypothetical protein T492DRAFT_1053476 [Pavlovales sp. CCMP2436]|nr:hypothetical protein T492DRAFT_1053476 [Pavlovales sp. CCMP2436]
MGRGYLARSRVRSLVYRVTRLQALWRAHKVQRGAGRKLRLMREALRAAHEAAKNKPKIGEATTTSLQVLLTTSNLGFVLKAVQLLDLSTSASVACCEQLLSSGALAVLVKLIRTCNRSAPHVQVATHAVSVLRNVCRYDYMMPVVFAAPDVVDTLTELLAIHRDKPEITTACLMTLRYFASRGEYARAMRSRKDSVGRLQSLAVSIERKNHAPGSSRPRVPFVRPTSRSGLPRTPTRRTPASVRSPAGAKRAAERSAHSETASLLHSLLEALV